MPPLPTAQNSPITTWRHRRRAKDFPAPVRRPRIRGRSNGRAIQPRQHSPSSTASVALCVAAANAMKANSAHFSILEVLPPCSTRMNSASTDSPAKRSVSSMLASQGSAVAKDQRDADRDQAKGLQHAEHAQRHLQDPQRRQRLDAEIDPERGTLAEMQIEAEHRGAARDQIALVPARQIAAGIPLKQRIAVPDRGREQGEGNGDSGRPDPGGIGPARVQKLRMDVASPRF